MYHKIVLYVLGIALCISCDIKPASELNDNKETDKMVSEGISADSFEAKKNRASIVAMSNIENPKNEDFTGKAYFTIQEQKFTLTIILNNADPGKYFIHLIKNTNCENQNMHDQKEMNSNDYVDNLEPIKVPDSGTGRNEIILNGFSNNPSDQIKDYAVVIKKGNGEIAGCGRIKKYVEQTNKEE